MTLTFMLEFAMEQQFDPLRKAELLTTVAEFVEGADDGSLQINFLREAVDEIKTALEWLGEHGAPLETAEWRGVLASVGKGVSLEREALARVLHEIATELVLLQEQLELGKGR